MPNYESYFSKSAGLMRESPIRQMGAVLANAKDIVSFAPGYPSHDAFAWDAFAEIARDVLGRADQSALQYGPTRGYPPLRDVISALMSSRGIDATGRGLVVTTGS